MLGSIKNNFCKRTELWKVVKFGLVGISNTLISYASYWVLLKFTVPWQMASPTSYALGMLNSYLLNKIWTFCDTSKTEIRKVLFFILVNLLAWGSGYLALAFFINLIKMSPEWAQIPAMLFSLVVNYLGNRFFVFKTAK